MYLPLQKLCALNEKLVQKHFDFQVEKKPNPLIRAMIVSRAHLSSFCSTGVRSYNVTAYDCTMVQHSTVQWYWLQNYKTEDKLKIHATTVIYMSFSFWLLAVYTDCGCLSQAEQIDKMTINSTIFNIIWGDHIIDQASDVPRIIFFS